MYRSRNSLVIFDADGTLIDAFCAIEAAFSRNGMDIGDQERFRKRRRLLKYLGGLREFPGNLRRQFGKQSRRQLIQTLTDVYRQETLLHPGLADLLKQLIGAPSVRVGIVTRNVTLEPAETMRQLLRRHDVDIDALDFTVCIPLREDKQKSFCAIRKMLGVNPALGFACGDEYSDYLAAVGAGLHPFIAAYGFENYRRLRDANVPEAVIAVTPQSLADRLSHALGLPLPGAQAEEHQPLWSATVGAISRSPRDSMTRWAATLPSRAAAIPD
ncbi:MAG: HAD family hydrolase [Sulfuritalea sp.]|nr:HAD family hydrolase [Sulfuritalea sp.]